MNTQQKIDAQLKNVLGDLVANNIALTVALQEANEKIANLTGKQGVDVIDEGRGSS